MATSMAAKKVGQMADMELVDHVEFALAMLGATKWRASVVRSDRQLERGWRVTLTDGREFRVMGFGDDCDMAAVGKILRDTVAIPPWFEGYEPGDKPPQWSFHIRGGRVHPEGVRAPTVKESDFRPGLQLRVVSVDESEGHIYVEPVDGPWQVPK